MNSIRPHRCRARPRGGRTGRGAGAAQRGGRAARSVLRARPFHQGPLHDRRNDRQQLLRRSLRRPRQDRRQRRGARSRCSTTAPGSRPARAARAKSSPPPRAADARARSMPRRARSRSARRTRFGGAIRKFRAASPATISMSCCPNAAQPGARAGRLGGHARASRSPRRSGWCRGRGGSRWWCSASTTFTLPPTRCRGFWSIARRRSRASTIICPTSRAPRGSTRCGCCPTAARF